MEIHWHPKIKRHLGTIKEYLLELILIFTAISLGYLAENSRENYLHSKNEKELIANILKELKDDEIIYNKNIDNLEFQRFGLDTILHLLQSNMSKSVQKKLSYYLCLYTLESELRTSPNNRSLNHLIYSGGYFNIEKIQVANKVESYYNYFIKNMDDSYYRYLKSHENVIQNSIELVSMNKCQPLLQKMEKSINWNFNSTIDSLPELRCSNNEVIENTYNRVYLLKLAITDYISWVSTTKTYARYLYNEIQKEYDTAL